MRHAPAIAAALALLAACRGTEYATLEGDIYVSRDGAVVRAAGSSVQLITRADSVLAELRQACQTHARELRRLGDAARGAQQRAQQLLASGRQVSALQAGDTARAYSDSGRALDRAHPAALDSLLAANAARHGQTDSDAHYRFDALPSGRYLVYGAEVVGGAALRWLDTVSAEAGQTRRRDLSDAHPAGELCQAGLLRGPPR